MSISNLDAEILHNTNLRIFSVVKDEYKCVYCKRIMVDSFRGPCCHGYCNKCLIEHLNNGGICVGIDNDKPCSITLELNVNCDRCHRTNKEIALLKAVCLNDSCREIVPLKEMREHMNICEFKKESEPPTTVTLNYQDSKDHSNMEKEDSIKVIKSEIKIIDDNVLHLDQKNEQKEETNKVNKEDENETRKRIEKIESIQQEYFEKLKSKNKKIKEINNKLIDDIQELKIKYEESKRYYDEIQYLKDGYKEQKEINKKLIDEIQILKEKHIESKEVNINMSKEIDMFKKEVSEQIKSNNNVSKDLSTKNLSQEDKMKTDYEELEPINVEKDNKNEIEITKGSTENLKKSIDRPLIKQTENNVREMNIDNFSDKVKLLKKNGEVKEIDNFIIDLNKYRVVFKFSVRRGDNYYDLLINLSLMKGEHDHTLTWPFKEKIKLDVMKKDGKSHGDKLIEYVEGDKWRNKVTGEKGEESKKEWIIGRTLKYYEDEILLNNTLKVKVSI